MTEGRKSIAPILRREVVVFLVMGLIGVLLLPLMIYLVGAEIFGAYSGNGFGDFYRDIHSNIRQGQPVVIFLVISPYLVWQLLRLSFYIFRAMAPARAPAKSRIEPEIR